MAKTPPFHGGATSSILVRAMGINIIPLYNMYLTLEAIAPCSLCGHASLIRMSFQNYFVKEQVGNISKW